MIKPFIFNSSLEKSDKLLKALEKLGLERREVNSSKEQESWSLSCPWKEKYVNLVWVKSYWEDGETLEDISLSIFIDDTLKTSIDIKELVSQKLTKPIRKIVIERVENELKNYMGKA